MQNKDLSQALKTVLTQQTMAVFGNKTAQALNEEFLSCHGNSLPHIHAGKTYLLYNFHFKPYSHVTFFVPFFPSF